MPKEELIEMQTTDVKIAMGCEPLLKPLKKVFICS